MPHRYKITGLQYKNGQSNDCPFLYLDLFILSQNLLYKSNMKFYSIRQSRVVKMHVRIIRKIMHLRQNQRRQRLGHRFRRLMEDRQHLRLHVFQ